MLNKIAALSIQLRLSSPQIDDMFITVKHWLDINAITGLKVSEIICYHNHNITDSRYLLRYKNEKHT